MTEKEAIDFVKEHGIVTESARGPVPSLAEAVAGGPIRGNWWSHPRSHEIFRLSRTVRSHSDVLTCRLVQGKISFVHRRLWGALVRLASEFPAPHLTAVREVHTPSGKHIVEETPFPKWVPAEVRNEARKLDDAAARACLFPVLRALKMEKDRKI
ncbi:MAG: hypothetical protein L0Z48_03450 [candidate division Zixibacteria bacterium]|nr:hypothetical protein [candidate division Zixibacteria bacterium]MCI0595581.1 hypothetical protein [candidate division Zixibacteria bacterium]